MPIYEFFCPSKGKIYSFFARSLSFADKIPLCPDGKHLKMVKMFSGFSISGNNREEPIDENGSGKDDNPFSSLDDSQAQRVVRELEGAVSTMDDENPDPKQMGALMRRMCDLTGEKMDENMEEVVRKLEEGTDPQELEERMGDFDGQEGEGLDAENTDPVAAVRRKLGKKPVRDPVLYEFEDYAR